MRKEIEVSAVVTTGGFQVESGAAASASISDGRLREFVEAYREEYNEEISLNEAREMLSRLVELYLHVARPLPINTTATKGREGRQTE